MTNVFLAFHFFWRKKDSYSFEAKRHNKEDLYLTVEEQAGGNRAKPIYGGVSEWFCCRFFLIKSLILSGSYSISEMKMHVIVSINPLQPQQPERLHRRGAPTHRKSKVLQHGAPENPSFESIIKTMFVRQAAGHVSAPSRAWL